ncbi:MAG: hypothetical protein ACWA5R_14380 [bacterium]
MNQQSKKISFLHHPDGWFHRMVLREAVLSLLLFMSFIGVAYTDFSGPNSLRFWLWMIPLFALSSIVLEWSRYMQGEIDGLHFIRQQILHWSAVFLAIKLIFILLQLGRLPSNGAAFVLMIIMGLSTFLAGIYTGWRFVVLGVFIMIATLFAAYLEAFVWVLIPLALVIIFTGVYIAWREFKSLRNHD